MHRAHTHPDVYTCAFYGDKTASERTERTVRVGQVIPKANSALVPFPL